MYARCTVPWYVHTAVVHTHGRGAYALLWHHSTSVNKYIPFYTPHPPLLPLSWGPLTNPLPPSFSVLQAAQGQVQPEVEEREEDEEGSEIESDAEERERRLKRER